MTYFSWVCVGGGGGGGGGDTGCGGVYAHYSVLSVGFLDEASENELQICIGT